MKYLMIAALLLIFQSGCSDVNPITSGSNNYISTLYPLKVGNVWNYHLIEYRSSGQIRSEKDFTQSVVDSIPHSAAITAYLVASSLKNDTLIQYYQNGTDLYTGYPDASEYDLMMRYPMNVGQTIVLREDQSPDYVSRLLLQYRSSNESVTVGAGTFNCVRFDYIFLAGSSNSTLDTASTTAMYFALNTGLVEQKDYFYEGGSKYLRYHARLLSYDLK